MSLRQIFIYMIILGAVTIYSGCGSGSNTTRYGKHVKEESKKEENTRFTSENDPTEEDSLYEYSDEYYDDEQDEDTMPEDEPTIDITEVMKKLSKDEKNTDIANDDGNSREKVLMEIIKYLNTPYKFGGNSMDGIDCSAFTQNVFSSSMKISLNRTARDQFRQGMQVDREELQFGDLVFFNTRRRVRPGHVGIYIGDNMFAHSSSKQGVIVSSLEHDYYSRTYMGGRRIEAEVVNN